MKTLWKKLSVATSLYIMIFALCALMSLISGVIYYSVTSQMGRRDLDTTITDIAAFVASLEEVRDLILEDGAGKDDNSKFDALSNLSQLDLLVICDASSTRQYHTIHDRIGEGFIGGDEGPILAGADPYISMAVGTMGLQRRAFHAVTDEDGRIIGFVMASVLNSRLDEIRARNVRIFFFVFLVIFVMGALIARLFQRSLFKVLLGHDPEEIAELYVERGELLESMAERVALTEQLTSANAMVETLRTVNHEFKNKLHVILGLMETGNTAAAKDYILDVSLASSDAVSDISHRIPNTAVAALLIGKMMRASELGMTFILKQDTVFLNKTVPSTESLVTVLGNLIENAMEELNSGSFPEKRIEIGLYMSENHTMILCDDTGGGIPDDILVRIYDRHTSTKGEGHGNGLHTIREIIDFYEGEIHIDTEAGEGTSIQIDLPV